MLSSFDIYKKEMLSGSLDWTPMHTSVRLLCTLAGLFSTLQACLQHLTGLLAFHPFCYLDWTPMHTSVRLFIHEQLPATHVVAFCNAAELRLRS